MLSIMRKSLLKCSFCGKSEKEVARLIGGPNVYICGGCVGTCNKILEATPATSGGWETATWGPATPTTSWDPARGWWWA